MNHSGRRESRIARRQKFALVPHLHDAAALEHEVKFVLSFVRMGRVLLPGLETVQSCEQGRALHHGPLAHFVRRKLREAGNLLYEHTGQFSGSGRTSGGYGTRLRSNDVAQLLQQRS